MAESYRLASSPLLLDIIHQLLPLYYVDYFTTSDLGSAPDFMKRADIQSLADAFDSADYAILAPSTTGTPQPTPTSITTQPTPTSTTTQPTPTPTMPSLALRYDPAGQDRDCDDFSNWQEAQAFFLATQDDSHGLDPDSDGIACEDLSGAPQPQVQQVVVTPTPTPSPSFPTTINAGTYRVGVEIATGLYRGIVPDTRHSSCKWERWRRYGDWSYVAEDDYYSQDGYQFYVRVLATDYELKTDCQLTRVTDFTEPLVTQLPNVIDPGMYLVSVEIKPGIYEGVVPTGYFSSCSWARHADFTGAYGERIDTGFNSDDGATFSVLVAPGDYGLDTNCRLTFVQ